MMLFKCLAIESVIFMAIRYTKEKLVQNTDSTWRIALENAEHDPSSRSAPLSEAYYLPCVTNPKAECLQILKQNLLMRLSKNKVLLKPQKLKITPQAPYLPYTPFRRNLQMSRLGRTVRAPRE
ncbi:hypothetical protein SK128_007492 [Halocaridina rubra]|uniref:Uncharacterized protein n=1 Tax=Halocaridina rubra TaxID=373956 RepID=A0AAN8WMN0_HALRR